MFCPGEDGKTRYSMHYTVSYPTVRGCSPRHIEAYLVLAELLVLDGEQVNPSIFWLANILFQLVFKSLICNRSFISTNNNHKIC